MPSPLASGSVGAASVLVLDGHLTYASLEVALGGLRPRPRSALIVDCTAMTGYDPAARALFVEWHRRHRETIGAVAVVTDNMLWHMIVRAMGLASGQQMRAFATRDEASAWLSVL